MWLCCLNVLSAGSNSFGIVHMDEELLATEFVHCVGQVIAAVIATSRRLEPPHVITTRGSLWPSLVPVLCVSVGTSPMERFAGTHTRTHCPLAAILFYPFP